LARLGHQAFCEGPVQCGQYPARAVHDAVPAGAIVGGLLGFWVAKRTARWQAASISRSRRSNER
jgi:hypothetical protein